MERELIELADRLTRINAELRDVVVTLEKVGRGLPKSSTRGRIYMMVAQLSTTTSHIDGVIKALWSVVKEMRGGGKSGKRRRV